ncbi:MAG: M20/M25/M40 family metallo-hydrolase [Caulobacterales bacterium]|nr:M20/M25/M40 family metallo-hydrolase [Caulobacterales bacterium]
MRSFLIALALSLTTSVTAFAQPAERPSSAVRFEAEQILYNRATTLVRRSPEARGEAAVALIRQAGFEPVVETFMGGDTQGLPPMEGRNITFVVPGHGNCGCEILLTAHYDVVRLQSGELADGLVDNGGSVVAVIEAARQLRDADLYHDVRVVLFDQEELGLLGSRAWIAAHGTGHAAAVVNSDVAAFGDTMMYGQNNGRQSLFVTQAVQRVCSERELQCVGYPNYPPSDDRTFSADGTPVVSLGFQTEIGAHQMWLAFNAPEGQSGLAPGFVPEVFTVIHSANDNARRMEGSTLLLAAETYAAVVREIDEHLESQ